MFTVDMVEGCPATRGSKGVMQMTPEIVGEIAGLVRDRIEWILLLTGERSDDGFTVKVTGFSVPQQYRSGGDAEIVDDIELPSNLVGVMHSHHTMGAFFSHIDKTTLNPRFPSSIVVASTQLNNLGFKYEAVGKVVLPCGSIGEVKFQLSIEGVSHYTFKPVRSMLKPEDLGDCNNSVNTESKYFAERHAACGLVDTVERNSVFGQTGQQVLVQIQDKTEYRKQKQGDWGGGSFGWGGLSGKHSGKYYGDSQIGYTAGNGAKQLTEGNGGGKKKKRAKLSARRNGLVKLERPTGGPTSSGEFGVGPGQYVTSGCDSCRERGILKFHGIFKEWYCRECTEEADEMLRADFSVTTASKSSFEDDSVVIGDVVITDADTR